MSEDKAQHANARSIVHLLSGGLDSVTMLYDLAMQGHTVHCLLFDYKQRHAKELLLAKHHCAMCRVVFTTMELPNLGGLTEPSWIVPNRNAVFLSVAVNLACSLGFDSVTIGCNADDEMGFPDCRTEFLEAMQQAVKTAGYSVQILAPYLKWPKWKIGGLARELGIKSTEIWTCYNGGDRPCGVCPACEKLKRAFA